jgi:hypothetical protein
MAAGVAGAALATAGALAAVPLAVGGLGVAIAAQNERVKASFTGLKDHVSAQLTQMAVPYENVLIGLAGKAQAAFDRAAPSLGRMFETAAPMVDRLATSLLAMVEGALPGFETALNAARPVIDAIAVGLTNMGPAISAFFTNLSVGAQGGATAVTLLFDAVNWLIPTLGTVLGFLAQWSGVIVPIAAGIGAIALVVQTVSAVTAIWNGIMAVGRGVMLAWAAAQWLVNAALSANPIGIVVVAIGALVAALIYAWNNSETFRSVVLSVWAAVKGGITSAVNAIKGVLNWFGSLPGMIGGWFNSAKDAAIGAFNNLVGWVRGLPGRIVSALGNLGSLLLGSGRALVDGFLSGIRSAWDRVVGFVRQGVQWVRNLFPFSPAKDGPFAGRGYVTYSGKALTEDFATSLRNGMGTVGAAARSVMAAAEAPFAGADLSAVARTAVSGGSAASIGRTEVGAPAVNVVVMIDGQEFKGMIRTEISESNRATRTAALAGRGTR